MPEPDLSFASVDQLRVLIRGFIVNEAVSPETSTDNLQKRLNRIAANITGEWKTLYNRTGNNPPPARPVNLNNSTLVNLILELLNLEEAWIDLTRDFIVLKYESSVLHPKHFKWLQEERRRRFKTGGLNSVILKHIKGQPLENDSFLTEADLAGMTPGLTLTEHTLPSLETARRIGQRESAWVRAEGAVYGYKNKISQLTTDQKTNWNGLVNDLAAPQVKRIALTQEYSAEVNDSIVTALKAGYANLEIFAGGSTKSSFL